MTLNNTPPRFSVAGGASGPAPTPQPSPPAPPQQAAAPAASSHPVAGRWSLTVVCPNVRRNPLLATAIDVTGPQFSARFSAGGQASGRLAGSRLALTVTFATAEGESLKGDLSLSQRDDAQFSGGGLVSGFGASTSGTVGGPDRLCTVTMTR